MPATAPLRMTGRYEAISNLCWSLALLLCQFVMMERYVEKDMRSASAIFATSFLAAISAVGFAGAMERKFESEVENSLKGKVPQDWFLRATWRDKTLVVFVSPPTPKSFELWYDADRQKSMMGDLCNAVPQSIWHKIGGERDIAIEHVVGGNGGKGSWRLSCRAFLAELKQQKRGIE